MNPKLIALIAVHMLLAVGGQLVYFAGLGTDIRHVVVFWTIASVGLSQQMLVGFWLAMGKPPWPRRASLAAAACAYLGVTSAHFGQVVQLFLLLAANTAMTLLWSSLFFAMRRWLRLERIDIDKQAPLAPRHFQFSILHLLIVTSLVALIIGITRAARASSNGSHWSEGILTGLLVVTFSLNALCAAWAPLSVHGHRLKIAAVFLVSLLFGSAASAGMYRHFPNAPVLPLWAHCAGLFVTVLVTLIMVLSLLVVRSSGYRLIRRAAGASPLVSPVDR